MKKIDKDIFFWVTIAFCVTIDQITKIMVINNMELGETIPLIEGVFHLTYTTNTGAAFSMFTGQQMYLAIFSLLASGFFIWYYVKRRPFTWLETIALSLVTAGGLGNLIDRVFRDGVVDFFDFRLINFAVFNVADSCVSIAAVLILVFVLKTHLETKKND